MTTAEIKNILTAKLKDEGTYFTAKHIKLTRIKDGYRIVIDDYTHRPFTLRMEAEDGCYLTTVYCDDELIYFYDSQRKFTEREALITIGYYAGTRF